ncbi:MAG: hypothetical protein IKE28_05260 [Solobacterium sp.]|nr:hypothetical protein [Solobacterium sp.]
MAKYSRMQKYKELRDSLQNDSESNIQTRDLYKYEQKLNQIAPDQFNAPQEPSPERNNSPLHASQGRPYVPEETQAPVPAAENIPSSKGFSKEYFQNSANYTTAFNNEYLDDYIREVKEYNINQGVAGSANTDLDILKNLRGESTAAPRKPYPEEEEEPAPRPVKPSYQEAAAKPAVKEADTADISFGNDRKKAAYAEPEPSAAKEKPYLDFLDEEEEEEEARPYSDTQTMTKEDIAAEVQRLINGAQKKNESASKKGRNLFADDTDTYGVPRSTNQQILNETTQMRAQLDDYEDNLNDVTDKVNHTNQILNVVLIILIIALSLVLAVVIYWVLLSKGVIS